MKISFNYSTGASSRRKASENILGVFRKTVSDLLSLNEKIDQDVELQEQILEKAMNEKVELLNLRHENEVVISRFKDLLNSDEV